MRFQHHVNVVACRTFDFVGAALSLILLSPLWIAIAIAVKLEDGGPVFFRQVRMGKDGKPFRVYKFRTMPVGSQDVTKVGRFLRPPSLDECGNLINVVLGHMSLVGPRPWNLDDLERISAIDPEYVARRHAVRPGWTGAAQQCRVGVNDVAMCRRLDLDFIEHWSLRRHAQLFWMCPRLLIRKNYATKGGRHDTWAPPIYCGLRPEPAPIAVEPASPPERRDAWTVPVTDEASAAELLPQGEPPIDRYPSHDPDRRRRSGRHGRRRRGTAVEVEHPRAYVDRADEAPDLRHVEHRRPDRR